MLALCYSIYDSFRISYRAKRTKTIADFVKSRKFLLFLVNMIAMTIGVCSAVYHRLTFNCFGGGRRLESASCPGGLSAEGLTLYYQFFTADAVANIFFMISKIMILQNCLRSAQLGGSSSAHMHEGPSHRITVAAVCLLGISCICWFSIAIVHASSGQDYANQLRSEQVSTLEAFRFRLALRYVIYSSGAACIVIATLCSFLYYRHTQFHLNLFLQPLQASNPAAAEHELADSREMKRASSSVGSMNKVISGNFRRLQVAAVLVACSFLIKAVLFLILAVGLGSGIMESASPGCPVIDYSNTANLTDKSFCDGNFNPLILVHARSILGSPLIFPIITLFMDPLTMMCVINPNSIHYQNLNCFERSFSNKT